MSPVANVDHRGRPIRSTSQIATAIGVPDRRAAEIITLLELVGIVEEPSPGRFRATIEAWRVYPRPAPKRGETKAAA